MPDYTLSPNDPGFYTPGTKWLDFSQLWSDQFAPSKEAQPKEYEAYMRNPANFAAFIRGHMPPRSLGGAGNLEKLPFKVPGYKPNLDSEERKMRRRLTQEVCTAAINVGYQKRYVAQGYSSIERLDYIFLRLGTDSETQKNNYREWDIRQNGTPEQKGAQLEKRMREALRLFNKCMDGISDGEIADQLQEMHECQDMVSAAGGFLSEIEKGIVKVSDETVEILRNMEKHAPLVDYHMKRVRAIMNPLYEVMDIDEVMELDYDTISDLTNQAEDNNEPFLQDFMEILSVGKIWQRTAKRVAMHDKILADFDVNTNRPTVQLVKRDNTISKTLFELKGMSVDLDNDWGYSHVLVTAPDGTNACYKINGKAEVERVDAEELQQEFLGKLRDGMSSAFAAMKEANKGFFIGSSAYRKSLGLMGKIDKAIKNLSDPPTEEQLRSMRDMLSQVAEKCSSYLDNKDPDTFTKDRERNRYAAVQKTLNACQASLAFYDLQLDAIAVQKGESNPALDPEMEIKNFDRSVANTRIKDLYAGSRRIPASNVGDVANKLRDEIHAGLQDALVVTHVAGTEMNVQGAREAMAKAVVLEMILSTRQVKDNQIVAGPVEEQYAINPKGVVESVMNNPRFQAMTENLTRESLYTMVMRNDAKALVETMTNAAQAAKNAPEVPVAQNVKEGPVANGRIG